MKNLTILLKCVLTCTLYILITLNFTKANITNYQHIQVGNNNAPVILYEFFALSCGACGKFHNETLTKIKRDFADTGKIKIIYISYPIYPTADYFAHSLLYTIKNKEVVLKLMDRLYKNQSKWVRANDPVLEVTNYALLLGVSKDEINNATKNQQIIEWFSTIRTEYADLKINATPTIYLTTNEGGLSQAKHKFVGVTDYDTLKKAIEEMLPK